MIYEDITVSGSISISGSFNVPNHASTASANQATGSLFFDTTAKLFKVFQSGAGALNVASQPFTPTPPAADGTIEYLLIGGGGSGGQLGGGGAGGHLSSSLANVTSGSNLTVTIGSGGASITSVVRGNNGTDSTIAGTGYTTATALGGGGGGGQGGASDAGTGKDGGSGGGGGENDAGTNTPGSGTDGQGNDGGTGGTGAGTQLSGGGGGGAGAVGSNAPGQSSGGAGGNGLTNKITGTSVTRAGGGGGGAWWYNNGGSSYGGAGGSGGGGAAGTTGNTAAISGTANTGGGGGGAGFLSSGWWISNSGTGGSGLAVLSYDSGSAIGASGGLRSYDNSRIAHIFNSSGTFKVDESRTFLDGTLDVFGDSSCIALYQFENNITDKSGNYNGTASGTANSYTQGYINKSVVMGGTDSNIATGIANGHTQTWAFWAYIPSGTSGDRIVTALQGSGDGGQGFTYWAAGGGLYLYDIIGGASNTTVTISWNNLDQWRHFAWVKNGTSSIVYENGAQIGTLAAVSGNFQTGNNINIGRGTYGSTLASLQMDNFRIFNKALSAAEVLTLFKGEE